MKFLPNTSKEYPLRFFIYWLIVWALLFLYSVVIMLPKISDNGHVVRKDVCLEEGTTGMFDEYTECLEYGKPNYVPVGEELKDNLKIYGFNSFLVVFIVGWFLRRVKKTDEKRIERETKKPFSEVSTEKVILNFSYCETPEKRIDPENKEEHYDEYCKLYKKLNKNKILTDKRIINFLWFIEPKKKEEYYVDFYDEYRKLYQKLKKGEPLEEIFRKDKDEYGYFLKIKKRNANSYKIELGDGSESCGSSRTWYVKFDEKDSVVSGDVVEICHYD